MATETNLPTFNIPPNDNDTLEKCDTEKGKTSFVNVLLAGEDNSLKGTIIYPTTTEDGKSLTESDSSITPYEKVSYQKQYSRKKSFKKGGGRDKSHHKVSVNDKTSQSMTDDNDDVFFDCVEGNKSDDKVLLSPAPVPTTNAWFDRKNVVDGESLTIERKGSHREVSESGGDCNLSPEILSYEKSCSNKTKENFNSQEKDTQLNQDNQKLKYSNGESGGQKISPDHSNKDIEENVNKQMIVKDYSDNNPSSFYIGNSEISSNISNDTSEVHQSNNKIRKKVYSKTARKNQTSNNERNKKDDMYRKRNGKNSRSSVSSLQMKNNKSPRLSVFQEYFDFNEGSIDNNVGEGNFRSGRNRNSYKRHHSEDYNYNESNNRSNGKQNNLYKERGPLPSWDEADSFAENEKENCEDYMGILENKFKNMIPHYTLPLFDLTKATEASTITYVSGESQVLTPPPKLPYRPVTISTSIDVFKKSQPLTPTSPSSTNYFSYPPYSPPKYNKPSFGSIMSPEQVKDCILRQMEYYLSEENLIKDTFTQNMINENGYISLSLLANFPKIKKLTNDINLVIDAIKCSTVLEMSDDYQYIRSKNLNKNWLVINKSINEMKNIIISN